MTNNSIWEKTAKLAAGSVLSCGLMVGGAQAGGDVDDLPDVGTEAWYLSVHAGANIPVADVNFRNSAGTRVDTDFDVGFQIGGAIGRSWSNFALGSLVPRTELEVSYIENEVDTLDFSGNGAGNEVVASGSSVSSVNLLGNLLFDFKNSSALTPYIGGGVGVAFTNLDIAYGGAPNLVDNEASFVWQVIGGVEFDWSQRVALFTDVRFRQIVDVNSDRRLGAAPIAGANGGNFEDDFNMVAINAGIKVRF